MRSKQLGAVGKLEGLETTAKRVEENEPCSIKLPDQLSFELHRIVDLQQAQT